MKKIFTLLSCIICYASYADKVTIKVVNNQFKPKTVNINFGDTILFQWKEGIHTTTSTSIPPGAIAWDKLMDSAHKKFTYVPNSAGTYKYNCTYHAPFMKGTINVNGALKQGLKNVLVKYNGVQALLSWNTISSNDLAYFSIQRSVDGDEFTEIGRVNPSAANSYQFTDMETTNAEYIYYQVEMVDIQGQRQLSAIKMFENKNVKGAKLITSISPNPVSRPGHLMMQFNAINDGVLKLQLYNTKGEMVKQTIMTAFKGLNNGHFHLGDLTPGSYYIICTMGSITEKHALVYR